MTIKELKRRLQFLLYQREQLGYEPGDEELEGLRWSIDGDIQKLRWEIGMLTCLCGEEET